MNNRSITQTVHGNRAVDGAGVHLVRVLGHDTTEAFDPFLMMDAFDSTDPNDYIKGFPWHPHRGIETITYLISGRIEHQDSLDNKGVIGAGDCQWMTAGSGIIHSEMPQKSDWMRGVQLWLNLPRDHKMTPPKYHDISHTTIPLIPIPGGQVRLISGKFQDTDGPMKPNFVQARIMDVQLEPGTTWHIEIPEANMAFAYVFEGEATVNGESMQHHSAVKFEFGDTLQVVTNADRGIRFILADAKPLHEPIAWGGPIAMNTQQELQDAFLQLRDHTFLDQPTD